MKRCFIFCTQGSPLRVAAATGEVIFESDKLSEVDLPDWSVRNMILGGHKLSMILGRNVADPANLSISRDCLLADSQGVILIDTLKLETSFDWKPILGFAAGFVTKGFLSNEDKKVNVPS